MKIKKILPSCRIALLSVCFICFFAQTAIFAADRVLKDWPVFHGPKGDNKSPDTGLLKSWPKNGPKLLWTADFIGFGYSSASLAGERIYISGNVNEDGKDKAMVFCLDKNGKLQWKNDNGSGLNERRRFPGTRSTPTIDGDFVYDKSAIGDLACFDAKTGKKIWIRNVMTDYDAPLHMWALAESVAIDGENLICSTGGKKASVLALNKRTGKTVWEAKPTGSINGFATPYFFEFDGLRVVAVVLDDCVLGLDPKNGFIRFNIPLVNSRKINATIPIYRNGSLYLTSGYGGGSKLFKLEKDGESIKHTEIWVERKFDNQHGGVVLVGDTVYGTSHNGSWCAIDFNTGKLGFVERVVGSGSVHFADGLIYALSEKDRTVILQKPQPDKYVEISRFQLPNEAEGNSWAHPVVLNGRLYLRHAQYLYCYDVSE